jgi:hypothetical protein
MFLYEVTILLSEITGRERRRISPASSPAEANSHELELEQNTHEFFAAYKLAAFSVLLLDK